MSRLFITFATGEVDDGPAVLGFPALGGRLLIRGSAAMVLDDARALWFRVCVWIVGDVFVGGKDNYTVSCTVLAVEL